MCDESHDAFVLQPAGPRLLYRGLPACYCIIRL